MSVCLTTGAAVTVTIASVELELWNPLTPWNVAETRAVPAVKKVCGSRAVPSAPGVTGVPTSAPSTLNCTFPLTGAGSTFATSSVGVLAWIEPGIWIVVVVGWLT